MRVLIIGSGGREHALAWKCAVSSQVTRVFVAPGNGGTALEEKVTNVALDPLDFTALIDFVRKKAIDLTVVGPEAPLVAGIVDAFRAEGLPCFGPSQAAAQLEGSKAFSKAFMQRHHIPTASFATFNDYAAALEYVSTQPTPLVIKADGLAAGKGVVIAENQEQAKAALQDMLGSARLGAAGASVVVEQFLVGVEVSFMVMAQGENFIPLATSQDHKTRDDGNRGPNTGGMGAFSPDRVLDAAQYEKVIETVIKPTLRGLAQEGMPYSGFLYAGLMISDGQPYVLEYNCRLGDPETQPLMMRLQSDLVDLLTAALDNRLATVQPLWDPKPAVGVVMASRGYPGDYPKGDHLPSMAPTTTRQKVFHAGTVLKADKLCVSGGRVLCATALGEDLAMAKASAYQLVEQVVWPNAYFRRDIAAPVVSTS